MLYTDPDGRYYTICETGSGGKLTNCSTISDEQFQKLTQNLSGGVTTETSGATTSFNNSRGETFAVALYRPPEQPIETRTDHVFAAVSLAPLVKSLASGIFQGITRGTSPQIVKLELDPALRGIESLGPAEINALIGPQQRGLLRVLWGEGSQGAEIGAQRALEAIRAGAPLPQGLTRATLLRYREVAMRVIREGKDIRGTQALRVQIIDEALKKVK